MSSWKISSVLLLLVFFGICYLIVIFHINIRLANHAAILFSQEERDVTFQQDQFSRRRQRLRNYKGIGRRIVNHAYQKTFRVLEESCPDDESLWSCMKTLRQNHSSPLEKNKDHKTNILLRNHTVYDENWPWWFKTMLRDGSVRPVHGIWHYLKLPDPPMEICAIEKIGTKQWRKVVCDVNGMVGQKISLCNKVDPQFPKRYLAIPNAAKVVFLRDPLERFLSAFLDKCVTKNRHIESHCEPSPIFKLTRDKYAENEFIGEFYNNPQTLFEAYVDAIPLKWNVHFLPEGLFCNGLYRTLPQYDFVGYHGPQFYNHLEEMLKRFPGTSKSNFTKVVRQTFEIDKHRHNTTQQQHVGVETEASSKLLKYYTPKTVRRVLQYLSMDYVKLNFPIPTWAEQMLQQAQANSGNEEDYWI